MAGRVALKRRNREREWAEKRPWVVVEWKERRERERGRRTSDGGLEAGMASGWMVMGQGEVEVATLVYIQSTDANVTMHHALGATATRGTRDQLFTPANISTWAWVPRLQSAARNRGDGTHEHKVATRMQYAAPTSARSSQAAASHRLAREM
jgi:hypothetical protein